jgi:hypothetical protein
MCHILCMSEKLRSVSFNCFMHRNKKSDLNDLFHP